MKQEKLKSGDAAPHLATVVRPLLAWFCATARDLPWRRTRDPYAIWISEIMLQQTQVKTVVPYWQRWMHALPDMASFAAASPEVVLKLWEGLGYYSRVRNAHQAAQIIQRQHAGIFPSAYDELLALPGLGRYTVGAVGSIAFNQPWPVVDGNVMRVLCRVFALPGDPRAKPTLEKLWTMAGELVATAARVPGVENCSHLNQALMELGAVVCLPGQPRCTICPLQPVCLAHRQGQTALYPATLPRARATPSFCAAFVLERRRAFWVRQRPPTGRNAGLWEFPNLESSQPLGQPARRAREMLGLKPPVTAHRLMTVKHSITRFRIVMDVYQVAAAGFVAARPQGRWLARHELEGLTWSSAHRKIVNRLLKKPSTIL